MKISANIQRIVILSVSDIALDCNQNLCVTFHNLPTLLPFNMLTIYLSTFQLSDLPTFWVWPANLLIFFIFYTYLRTYWLKITKVIADLQFYKLRSWGGGRPPKIVLGRYPRPPCSPPLSLPLFLRVFATETLFDYRDSFRVLIDPMINVS